MGKAFELMASLILFVSVLAPGVCAQELRTDYSEEELEIIEIEWLFGEVISVDLEEPGLSVQYLDYDTDQEKKIEVTLDADTTLEGVAALSEIKNKDIVSVDYVLDELGRRLAKRISVERL